jgi:cytochrome d ubiquinol oxidase subunit II
VLGLVWILLQGTTWLTVKVKGELYERVVRLRAKLLVAFAAMFLVATAVSRLFVPYAVKNGMGSVVGWVFVLLMLAGFVVAASAASEGGRRSDLRAFYGTSLTGVALVGIWGASIFPALVPSLPGSAGKALTIANSSSSPLTLTVMLIVAVIGTPLMLYYFYLVYRTYAGRIDPEPEDVAPRY